MFTAKDMWGSIKDSQKDKGEIVDLWLKEVVLPAKLRNSGANRFVKPDGVSSRCMEDLLKERGFSVHVSEYLGVTYVCIVIPPQGE